jgi:transcription initiation factor TFIIIB Brf1 subunit/transcription initiation factor TFIIB
MPEVVDDTDEYVAVCARCGIAIKTHEVGGELDGRFVDYTERMQGVANFVLCLDHWEEFKNNSNTSVEDGIIRRIKNINDSQRNMDRYL